ncbi:MAG: hypothetical protein ACYDCE_10620 [Candidatus Acidiferrales bacterium]
MYVFFATFGAGRHSSSAQFATVHDHSAQAVGCSRYDRCMDFSSHRCGCLWRSLPDGKFARLLPATQHADVEDADAQGTGAASEHDEYSHTCLVRRVCARSGIFFRDRAK